MKNNIVLKDKKVKKVQKFWKDLDLKKLYKPTGKNVKLPVVSVDGNFYLYGPKNCIF